ncbi:MAG: S41 family peptidase [Pseudomonadota bacterium]
MTKRVKAKARRSRGNAGAVWGAALAGSLATAAALSAGFATSSAVDRETFRQLDLFGEVFEKVHANYVMEPEDAELIEGAIDGMLARLDPHSSYLSPGDYRSMQDATRGQFAGLGISVTMDTEGPAEGFVRVVSPIQDTPAARAGIVAGDLITAIDGEAVRSGTLDDAISKMKGPRGTDVTLTIMREGEDERFDVSLTRDIITVPSVTSRVEGDEYAYVRINTFSEQTFAQLKKSLKDARKEIGMEPRGLVLDLRSNPGGLLDQAVAVSDFFLDRGEIVSTRGRRAKDTMREMGSTRDQFDNRPVVVLIDAGSASASEIVAGAIQDRKRGLVLGTRSFGKGSVQTVLPLRGGVDGALRLTTARYYTPNGRSIQATGIEPDIWMPIVRPGSEPLERRSEADLPNALDVPSDVEELPAETRDLDDPLAGPDVEPVECPIGRDCQLERAIELLRDQQAYTRTLASAN